MAPRVANIAAPAPVPLNFLLRRADHYCVPVLCLQYPNGRIHRLSVDERIRPGEEFDLYGHRWKVVGPEPRVRGTQRERSKQERPLLCRQAIAHRG